MNFAGWLLLGTATPVLLRAGRASSLAHTTAGLWLATFGALLAWSPLAAGLLSIAAVTSTACTVTGHQARVNAKVRARRAVADSWR